MKKVLTAIALLGGLCIGARAQVFILNDNVFQGRMSEIKATVLETLERLGVENARVTVVDKGALDCTLKARVECAVFRSCDCSAANIPWGGVIR